MSMKRIADAIDALSPDVRKLAAKRAQPAWIGPMLATLVDEPFSGNEWIFETKFDGIRCLAFRRPNRVELFSRNHLPLDRAYPELVEPLEAQQVKSYIADGEIVAFKNGVTGKNG